MKPAKASRASRASHSPEPEETLPPGMKEATNLRAALDEQAIVAITDPQGRSTFANDKFCAISQYSREGLLGQDHPIINSGHHPEEFFRDLWRTSASGIPKSRCGTTISPATSASLGSWKSPRRDCSMRSSWRRSAG